MNNLLIVYNICGLSGRELVDYYLGCLQILNDQCMDGNHHLCVSSCCNNQSTIDQIRSTIPLHYLNTVYDVVPVNVTFNHAVKNCVRRYGEYEGYMYVDSGVYFNHGAISNLYELFKSGPYGMVSCKTDTDFGTEIGWLKNSNLDNHFEIPVGQAVNLHAQIFSNKLLEYYGGLIPDIFAGHCTESVFSFLCAALKLKWVIHKDRLASHAIGLDGGSSGFLPDHWEKCGNKKWDHPFGISESLIEVMKRGYEFGMGYEELQQIQMHNPEKFDENGFAIDDRLKDFIKKELFRFNYETISNTSGN